MPAKVPYVDIGETVEINVVAENEGDFTETFDVSCFWSAVYAGEEHFGSIGTSQTVTDLPAGATLNLTFYWNTEGRNITYPDKFALHANASRVPYEYDVEWSPGRVADNERSGNAHRIRFHDIALSQLTPSETTVTTPGDLVPVEITVTNQGDFNETNFVVKLWAQKDLDPPIEISNKTFHLMTNKSFSDTYIKTRPPYRDNYTITLMFPWDTTGVTSGTYTISAEASVVPVEYQITDNVINRLPPQWDKYPVDWDGVAGTDFYISVLKDMTSIEAVSDVGGSKEKMEVNFNVTGPPGTTRYCYVAVPKDALKGYPCLVLLDGDDKTSDAFIRQNSTHMFFYFTCEFLSSVSVHIFGPNLYPVDYPIGGPIDYYVDIASNSTVSNFAFSTVGEFGNITFDVTGGKYCAVGIPTELLGPDYTVYLDEISVSFTLTSNATHSFLYLPPYSTDGHEVIIKGTAPDNEPPTADAGDDQTVDEDTIVTFDGRDSTDNIGIVDYTWTFTDETPQTLTGVTPTYNFTNPGVYVVTLTVTDARNNQDTDDVTITVLDVTMPIADAGDDQTVNEDTIVTFDGRDSTDNVGIESYVWTFTEMGVLKTLTGVTPTYSFTMPSVTPYTVTLNVSDAAGNWDTDEVVITVLDITPPVANAGLNRTVDEDTEVTFNGSASTDNEPVSGIESYVWTFTDVTPPETKEGKIVTYTFETPGTYTVTLNVTDIAGYWDVDAVEITVIDVTKPIADAGLNQTVNVGEAVDFDAGGSSDNVGVVSYEWDFGDGSTATGVTTSHTYEESGEYTVTLTVKDAGGNTDTDVATITVRAPEGFPIWAIGVIVVAAIGVVVALIFLRRARR